MNSLKIKKNIFMSEIQMDNIDLGTFDSYFIRRIKGEPISKILNSKEFWSLDYFTNKYVLDPRPETEMFIEYITKNFNDFNKKLQICDLGAGSGCIIITLLKKYIRSIGVGYEISKKAIQVAEKNAKKHNVKSRLKLLNQSWNKLSGFYDIIVSNPPYIKESDYHILKEEVKKYDPKVALYGGKDGYDKFREIASIVSRSMRDSSLLILEIGINQSEEVEKIFFHNNLQTIEIIEDFQKIKRIMVFNKIK